MEKGEMIKIENRGASFGAYFVAPGSDNKLPGLLVIHEVWGLTEHIKDVSRRFAARGYRVLAPDLLSETGITQMIDQDIMKEISNPETRSEAQKKMRAAMAPLSQPEFGKQTIEKLEQAVTYLLDGDNSNGKTGVAGYCFGGTYSYSLAVSDSRIAAAAAYYGHAPDPIDEVRNIRCPILAFYGEKDKNLTDTLPELKEEMDKYGIDFESIVYPETGHAFFNDTNPVTYNRPAADDSWKRTLDFLERFLKK